MKIKPILILSLLTCYTVIGYTQRLYMANANSGPVNDFISNNHLGRVDFIYQNEFITNNTFDEAKLIKTINYRFPDSSHAGMAILDWEGPGFDGIKDPGEAGVIYRRQFTEAIQKAKLLRPNIKWSYYGFPLREFWNPDENWKQKNLSLIFFFSNFDFLAPSLYIFYSPEEVSAKTQQRYIDANMALAKQIADQLDKPVFALVNHRYHPSNKQSGNQQVPVSHFTFYVKRILTDRANGVVWWHSEDYNYNISKLNNPQINNAVFKADFEHVSKEDGIMNMLNTYYSDLKNNISGLNKN